MSAARHLRVVPPIPTPASRARAKYAKRRRLCAEWKRDRIWPRRYSHATRRFADWLVTQRYDERVGGYVLNNAKAERDLGLGRMTVIRIKARLIADGALVEVQRGCRRRRYSVVRLVP